MKTHAKVWLWIVLIANIFGALFYIRLLKVSAFYWTFLATSVAVVVSMCLLLFKHKKLGFYLFCGIEVIVFFLSLYVHLNFMHALLYLILPPVVAFLFIESSWDSLS